MKTRARLARLDEIDWLNQAYAANHLRFPIIGSVCSGLQSGMVWGEVDVENAWVLVIHRSGFCQALFKHQAADHDPAGILQALLACRLQDIPGYLMWYNPGAEWLKALSRLAPSGLKIRSRMRWDHRVRDRHQFPFSESQVDQNTSCIELNTRHLQRAQEDGLVDPNRFWGTSDTFMNHALAHGCVTSDDKVTSICYAAALYLSEAEIDVATQADSRGLGHAGKCTAAFIVAAARKEIAPLWDCFVDNAASMKLAESLGFAPLGEYPFATFGRVTQR